jgi:hypothetical protein
MSKAFTPPDSLSDDDILAIADVRRSVWTGGFRGLAFGLCSGVLAHFAAKTFLPPKYFPVVFKQGKYAFLWTLGGGAVFSFVGASVAGKNSVHWMHDTFNRGAVPVLSPYQELLPDAAKLEIEAADRRRRAVEEHRLKKNAAEAEESKRTLG